MFMVIFEVQPKPDRSDDYLALAKQLWPKLAAIDGFIDNERFGSKRTKGRVLSLSTWRDEKSVVRWRTQGKHHAVQAKGRFEVFEDYHLRVGEVTADSAPPDGFLMESQRCDETEIGAAKFCTITELPPPRKGSTAAASAGLQQPSAPGLLDHELFESITAPGKMLMLAAWQDDSAATSWHPKQSAGERDLRHRVVRVIREYGMFDRREAPQFYRDVATEKSPRATR